MPNNRRAPKEVRDRLNAPKATAAEEAAKVSSDPQWSAVEKEIEDLKSQLKTETNFAESYQDDRNELINAMVREMRYHALRAAEIQVFLRSFGVDAE